MQIKDHAELACTVCANYRLNQLTTWLYNSVHDVQKAMHRMVAQHVVPWLSDICDLAVNALAALDEAVCAKSVEAWALVSIVPSQIRALLQWMLLSEIMSEVIGEERARHAVSAAEQLQHAVENAASRLLEHLHDAVSLMGVSDWSDESKVNARMLLYGSLLGLVMVRLWSAIGVWMARRRRRNSSSASTGTSRRTPPGVNVRTAVSVTREAHEHKEIVGCAGRDNSTDGAELPRHHDGDDSDSPQEEIVQTQLHPKED